MLDYRDSFTRKQIASILVKVAMKIEKDEEFARLLFEEMKEPPKRKKSNTKKVKQEEPLKVDIFEIYQKEGAEKLSVYLQSLEVQELRKVVLDHGLDPAQKVRRWRRKEKIIHFILDAVTKQMAKGGAFLR